MMRTLMIYSFSNFQIDTTALITIVIQFHSAYEMMMIIYWKSISSI